MSIIDPIPLHEPPIPRILPRLEHPISRKDIDPDVLRILYRLHGHGSWPTFVGGCVRDLLLGKSPKTSMLDHGSHPLQIRELFLIAFNRGRFRLAHIYFKGEIY